MTPVSPCTRFLWSGEALRASGSEKLEPPDWPMRSRLVHSIATEWRWRMMREELMKTNSVQWFETGSVKQQKEKGEEIALGSPVLGAGRANTFLPREQGSERWEFLAGVKEVGLCPPCLIEQIDPDHQAPPLDPSPLLTARPFLPLIGTALCQSEEDSLHTNHRAARQHSPGPQSRVTPALLPPTHSHIHSHTLSPSQMWPGLSMEFHPSLKGLDRLTETCVPQTPTPPLQSLAPLSQMLLLRTLF